MLSKELTWAGQSIGEKLLLHWDSVLRRYLDSGLVSDDTKPRLFSSDISEVFPITWEAYLYEHFLKLGHTFSKKHLRKSGQHGPDFCLETNESRIWIEATTLSPKGLPREWLEPIVKGKPKVKTVPHEAILLRWTGAVKEKHAQLLKRLGNNIVKETDAYVIAINSAMCFDVFAYDEVVSRWPYAAECVFPIGPVAVSIDPSGKTPSRWEQSLRYSIINDNKATVPTNTFLSQTYSGISGIIGCSMFHTFEKELQLVLVRNPLAQIQLPERFGSIDDEVFAVREDDETFTIHRKRAP